MQSHRGPGLRLDQLPAPLHKPRAIAPLIAWLAKASRCTVQLRRQLQDGCAVTSRLPAGAASCPLARRTEAALLRSVLIDLPPSDRAYQRDDIAPTARLLDFEG